MTKKLSQQQLEAAAHHINRYSRVDFLCDGFKVTLVIRRRKMKLVVAVYVNDEIKQEWLKEPEQHAESKFLPTRFSSCYPASTRSRLIKMLGKREAKRAFPNLDDKDEYKDTYWSSAKTALNYLNKVSDSIEVLTDLEQSILAIMELPV